MRFIILGFTCIVAVAAQQKPYIWDLLKPALNAAEVQAILASSRAGADYPTYNGIPESAALNYDCGAKKQPGFYADVSTQCQVFHRCDINGNHTSYICVNTTVFNQITLVCDYFFNVDCVNSPNVEDFANSRLYTDLPLFDTPTDPNYIPSGAKAAAPAKAQASKPVRASGKGAAGGKNRAQKGASTTTKKAAKKTWP